MTVRTRFAPSPTGVLHLGSIRTALFNWLYARRYGGEFLLRIEDTDVERSTQENVEAIFDGMNWLNLDADIGPIFQSNRTARYREVIQEWLAAGTAYRCYCSRERLESLRQDQLASGGAVGYDGHCRDLDDAQHGSEFVVRFRNPLSGAVEVNDAVRGRVVFQNEQLDDLIIARSDGSPTYNFCVVIDDYDMQITHVIRGDDHLNNTPRQINMFTALGVSPPKFAHLPMILGPDGAKLSKRHGAVDIREYRDLGYLPDAMLNYLVRLGWSHGDQELFSVREMIEYFDIVNVNQSASAFNPEKLLWINHQHLMHADIADIADALAGRFEQLGVDYRQGPDLQKVVMAYRERSETIVNLAENCLYCFVDFDEIDPKAFKKHMRPVALQPIKQLRAKLEDLAAWTAPEIIAAIESVSETLDIKLGRIGQPLRVAVTGGPTSPPIDITLELIGRDRVLERIDRAVALIEAREGKNG